MQFGSFITGCLDGWHGEIDILIEVTCSLPVKLIDEDCFGDREDSSVSSIGVKGSEYFSVKNE